MKMVEDALYNLFFIIDVIVIGDYIKIRAVLNHSSKGAQGQFLKSSKGKLDEEIQDPSFLADPSHCMKVISKHIYSIVNKSRSQRCGYTKAYSLRLNKDWGYMIKNNRKKTTEEFSEASKVPPEHRFNSHDNCSA